MITFKNSLTRYGQFSIFLHWSIALLFIALVALGLVMTNMDDSDDKWALYSLHKSLGFTVAGLIIIRIFWRLSQPVPLLPDNLAAYEKWLAHLVHIGLYSVMILMPISGYLDSVAGGYKTEFFGLTVPKLVAENKSLAEISLVVHQLGSYALYGLFALHFGAVLKHQFILKDDVLRRMLPVKVRTVEE